MIVELHVIQNLAPSNINRDDLGSPKDAYFGGYRRARVSSQSWKRAMRKQFESDPLFTPAELAVRSKQMIDEIHVGLLEKDNTRKKEDARRVAEVLLQGISILRDGTSPNNDPLTQYLLFLGRKEIDQLVEVADKNWEELSGLSSGDGKATKKDLSKAISDDTKRDTAAALDGGKAADLALFGRMLADLPGKNVKAAVQVAHAISTHAVDFEQDFYTAVDDLNTAAETGAGMMGYVGFDSATLYRYLNIDTTLLIENLNKDTELARKTVRAAARAFVTSMPTGKQNSMASPTLPALSLAVVRVAARWSLANAFAAPVPTRQGDLVGLSIAALGQQWRSLTRMYGADDVRATPALIDERYANALGDGFGGECASISAWLDEIISATQFELVS